MSSDEEIPYTEPSCKYHIIKKNRCLVIRKIPLSPANAEMNSPGRIMQGKGEDGGIIIVKKLKKDRQKRKLNDENIADLLCNGNSSECSDTESEDGKDLQISPVKDSTPIKKLKTKHSSTHSEQSPKLMNKVNSNKTQRSESEIRCVSSPKDDAKQRSAVLLRKIGSPAKSDINKEPAKSKRKGLSKTGYSPRPSPSSSPSHSFARSPAQPPKASVAAAAAAAEEQRTPREATQQSCSVRLMRVPRVRRSLYSPDEWVVTGNAGRSPHRLASKDHSSPRTPQLTRREADKGHNSPRVKRTPRPETEKLAAASRTLMCAEDDEPCDSPRARARGMAQPNLEERAAVSRTLMQTDEEPDEPCDSPRTKRMPRPRATSQTGADEPSHSHEGLHTPKLSKPCDSHRAKRTPQLDSEKRFVTSRSLLPVEKEADESSASPRAKRKARLDSQKRIAISRRLLPVEEDSDESCYSPRAKRTPRRDMDKRITASQPQMQAEEDADESCNSHLGLPAPQLSKISKPYDSPQRLQTEAHRSHWGCEPVEEEDIPLALRTPRRAAKKVTGVQDASQAVRTPRAAAVKAAAEVLKVGRSSRTPRTPQLGEAKGAGAHDSIRSARTPRRAAADGATESDCSRGSAASQGAAEAAEASLPGRERELASLRRFIGTQLADGAGGCLYVSGVPGTGKTASVRTAVASLRELEAAGDLPRFQFVEVNGMQLTQPRRVYSRLWEALADEQLGAEAALHRLDRWFGAAASGKAATGTGRPHLVLLVDEVDALQTRRQDVLYNLLDWPARRCSRLTVIAIANTMDLPERTLKTRVNSRMGLTRLTFQPYSFQQLQRILSTRLPKASSFEPEALEFIARKVASLSGDARRALEAGRRAAELAAEGQAGDGAVAVRLEHAAQALAAAASPLAAAVAWGLSELQRLLLATLEAELTARRAEETTLAKLQPSLADLCALSGLRPVPSGPMLAHACARLAAQRLVLAAGPPGPGLRLRLNVPADEVLAGMALRRNPE